MFLKCIDNLFKFEDDHDIAKFYLDWGGGEFVPGDIDLKASEKRVFDGEWYIMQLEKFIDLIMFKGCVLDVYLSRPESQLHILQAGYEFTEVATQYGL
jgi:hypothetical protein